MKDGGKEREREKNANRQKEEIKRERKNNVFNAAN
jgi:hypothetical protein